MKLTANLKASSLANAILVCVMISIFSGCLVLISHYQNHLNFQLQFRETLINTNNAAFQYYITNIEMLEYNNVSKIDVFDEDVISYVTKKKWGFYDILYSKTQFKNDTIDKVAMVGIANTASTLPSLFLTNYDKLLKVSGNSKIIGKLEVPKGNIEIAYINGQAGNTIKISPFQLSSKDKLPDINTIESFNLNNYKTMFLNEFNTSKPIVNTFSSETIIIDISGVSNLANIIIKGNFILFSGNTINISNSAQLKDIILYAKNVTVAKNFSGNLQIIAKNNITINENAHLKYPSSIYLKNDIDSVKVHFKKSAKLAGGIVINGNSYKSSLKKQLLLDEQAEIYGLIYCYGSTQLKGTVIGSIYTDRFFLKTQSSNYGNIILNGTIDGSKLPDNFVQLPLFKTNNTHAKYKIIKEF